MSTDERRNEQPKRLLFVLQYFYPDISGLSQMIGDLTERLSEGGVYDCTVLTGSTVRSVGRWNRLPRRLGEVKIRRIRTVGAGKRTFLHRLLEYSGFYVGVLLFLLVHGGYDVVICLTTPPLIGLAVIAGLAFSRASFIYYVQDLYPELLHDMGYIKSPWLIRKLSIVNSLILRRADRVVTIGSWMAKKIHRNYALPQSSIIVIDNWSQDFSYILPSESDPFVVLYSGNVGLAHDFSLLPQLLNEIGSDDAVRLRFVGSGRRMKSVQRMLSKRTGFPCDFTGYVERNDLGSVLASAHVFLLAQSEATVGDILPSKFYSYLAAGRPILFFGTAKSEIGETILRNGIGMVVECESEVTQAARTMRQYARRGADYREACERARWVYQETMGLARSASRFEFLLNEVVAR